LCDFLGRSASELVGASAMAFMHPDERELATANRDGLANGVIESWRVERRFVRSDGRVVWGDVSTQAIRGPDGVARYWQTVIIDITGREQAAIVRSSADAIVGRTLNGTITSWNAGAEALYGYSADEAIGNELEALIPEDRRAELDGFAARLAKGERIEPLETQRMVRDGSMIDVSMTVSPIRDENGALVGTSTVARDITALKQVRAERDVLTERMQQSQRLESLGELAGGVAHDFNNLLAVILNYTSFVAEQTRDNEDVQADLEQIKTAAKRAADLTRQLLIFGRRETVRPEIIDLNSIVVDMHALLSRSIGEHVVLAVHTALEPMLVNADRGQIEQVLVSLALNARDAMPDGGTLTIETSVTDLDDDYSRLHPEVAPGRFVELSVSDTGVGISAEVRPHIFEPFFTTKPTGEGTGLGLATVYGIVSEAGGSVSVYSEVGTGTTFRLFFPASDRTAVVPAPVSAATPTGTGQTILVVEDEPAMMEVTARMLARNGYDVVRAPTGAEALEIAAERHIDLLLTDSVMPRMSGRELAERIQDVQPGLPVLFMSGYSQGVLGPQRIVDDNVALIQKPFNERALLEYVRRSLPPS